MLSSFRASVDPSILDKVTRFFNASLHDVFIEVIQNARRADAAHVDVWEVDDKIVVRDDGSGIDDPRTLLTLGQSRWDAATLHAEDPAGCGIFALGPRGVRIQSRPAARKAGWVTTFRPDHFTGKAAVTVEACSMEPGTELVFPRFADEHVETTLKAAARFCSLPISLNGKPLEQVCFLDGALHVDEWRGVHIGAFPMLHSSVEPRINFCDLTLAAPLPSVSMVMIGWSLSARIDVIDCPELKLVLPARNEIVRDDFFKEVTTEVKHTLYRAIAAVRRSNPLSM